MTEYKKQRDNWLTKYEEQGENYSLTEYKKQRDTVTGLTKYEERGEN